MQCASKTHAKVERDWLVYDIKQDTGHAVFLPKSGVPGGGNEGQKKKKKGKK